MPERADPRCAIARRVEYDGTDFAGFQVQPGSRTVQGILEAALASLGDGAVAAGRRGRPNGRRGARHGTGDRLLLATGDSRRRSWAGARCAPAARRRHPRTPRRAPQDFHPRYAARYREYRYTVWNGPRSPLRERTALGVRVPLDTAAMERAGSAFIGRHDFSAFGATDRLTGPDRHGGPGPAGGPARDDRRPGRRLPARDGPAHRGRPPGGGPGKMDTTAVRCGTRRRRTGPRRGSRPGQGPLPPARRPRATTGTNERRTRGTMNAKTYAVRESEIERRWFVVDATDETLGRLASRIARVLEGKHKPLVPAEPRLRRPRHRAQRRASIAVTQRQARDPSSTSATAGYPQGFKQETLGHLLARRPEEVIRRAVKGMLPHNRLGAQQLRKLKVYAGRRPPASGPAA